MKLSKPRLTVEDWHLRFIQQSIWTRSARQYVFNQIGISEQKRILEVGCGTAAITHDLHNYADAIIHGLDINPDHIHFAHKFDTHGHYTCGDALHLPYNNASFDLTICHFLLIWLKDAQAGLAEMFRVTRPGGFITALAEPDHERRLDYPYELVKLGQLQKKSLEKQGADTQIGRRLKSAFNQLGLIQVHCGLLGGQWDSLPSQEFLESEWMTLEYDLSDIISKPELQRWKKLDMTAWQTGERILFIPTFYAWGQVPKM